MFDINLQLFAEEEEIETTEAVDEPENEVEETVESEEETVEETEEKPPKKDEVPLSKYMAEKKRRQELERVLAQQESERQRLALEQSYLTRGYPENEAKQLASEKVEQQLNISKVESRLMDMDIKDLTKDPFFADAEAYADEIKETMRSMKVDAEKAYMVIRGPVRMREYQVEQEQQKTVKRTEKKVTNSKPMASKDPYPLSQDEAKTLAGLQKAQPDAGWTKEKLYKRIHGS